MRRNCGWIYNNGSDGNPVPSSLRPCAPAGNRLSKCHSGLTPSLSIVMENRLLVVLPVCFMIACSRSNGSQRAVRIRAQDFDFPLTRLGVDIRNIQVIDVVGGRS